MYNADSKNFIALLIFVVHDRPRLKQSCFKLYVPFAGGFSQHHFCILFFQRDLLRYIISISLASFRENAQCEVNRSQSSILV